MGKWKITQRSCNSNPDRDGKFWESLWKYYLSLWFWNFSVHWGPLEALFKYRLLFPIPECLIQDFPSGARDLAFPTSCQMMLVLLIRGQHFGTTWVLATFPCLVYTQYCVFSHFSSVHLSETLWTKAQWVLWDFLTKIIGVGFHSLLQGISPTKGSNPSLLCLLSWRWILHCWATLEAHINNIESQQKCDEHPFIYLPCLT